MGDYSSDSSDRTSDYRATGASGPENDTVFGEVINGLKDLIKKDADPTPPLLASTVTESSANDGSGEDDGEEGGSDFQVLSEDEEDDEDDDSSRSFSRDPPPTRAGGSPPPTPAGGPPPQKPVMPDSRTEFVPWEEEETPATVTPPVAAAAPPSRIQVSNAFRFSPASKLATVSAVPPTFAAQKSPLAANSQQHDFAANIWSSGAFLRTLAKDQARIDATLVRTLHTSNSQAASLVFRASLGALRDAASVAESRPFSTQILSQDELADMTTQSRDDALLSSHLKVALEGNKRVPHFDWEPTSRPLLERIATVSGSIVASTEPAKRGWVEKMLQSTRAFCESMSAFHAEKATERVSLNNLSRAERLAAMAEEKMREAAEFSDQ